MLLARILAVVCWFQAGKVIGDAIALWHELHDPNKHAAVSNLYSYIPRQVERFLESGCIFDRSHQPATKLVPDDVAREASAQLKRGYFSMRKLPGKKTRREQVHLYYSSIKQACAHNSYLRDVTRNYSVTPEHLLERMHQVDPKLKWRALDYKMELSTQQKQERMKIAGQLLRQHRLDPDFLKSIFWIDEVSIWLVPKDIKVHVYADAHDKGVHAVLTSKHIKSGARIKVRALCVVNALYGPCFCEFTTGTTDIRRMFNHVTEPYKVCFARVIVHKQQQAQFQPRGIGWPRNLCSQHAPINQ